MERITIKKENEYMIFHTAFIIDPKIRGMEAAKLMEKYSKPIVSNVISQLLKIGAEIAEGEISEKEIIPSAYKLIEKMIPIWLKTDQIFKGEYDTRAY